MPSSSAKSRPKKYRRDTGFKIQAQRCGLGESEKEVQPMERTLNTTPYALHPKLYTLNSTRYTLNPEP